MTLKLFMNEAEDFVIAESPEDATVVMRENGMHLEPDDEWSEYPADKSFTFTHDDRREETKTAAEWCAGTEIPARHLEPWENIPEIDREVDRVIAEAVVNAASLNPAALAEVLDAAEVAACRDATEGDRRRLRDALTALRAGEEKNHA